MFLLFYYSYICCVRGKADIECLFHKITLSVTNDHGVVDSTIPHQLISSHTIVKRRAQRILSHKKWDITIIIYSVHISKWVLPFLLVMNS